MKKSRFYYLLEKIEKAEFRWEPYKHIYLENFFSEEDFAEIISDSQICIDQSNHVSEMIQKLKDNGWEHRPFGGSTVDEGAYIRWRNNPNAGFDNTNTAEGFGMVYDLKNPESNTISAIKQVLGSDEFFELLGKKFSILPGPYRVAAGCHKYLTGYEISPHPDQRNKALTYMVNINPEQTSEQENHHTHYMKLKSEYKYISSFWEGNSNVDRSWLPWNWCETVFTQHKNNSIVIFSPTDHTLHAVKARYDDLKYQRTQFYGNLWYDDRKRLIRPNWESLEIKPSSKGQKAPLWWRLKNKLLREMSRSP